MTTTADDLLDRVVAALAATDATDAGSRVYSPGDWPTWDNQYPAIKARIESEDKIAIGHASINFTVTATIRLLLQVSAPAAAADGGAGAVEVALRALRRQIEVAIINSYPLTSMVQQFASVRGSTLFSSEGEKHLGTTEIDIALEFYQGVADFAPIAADDLTLVEATVLKVGAEGPDAGIAIELPSP